SLPRRLCRPRHDARLVHRATRSWSVPGPRRSLGPMLKTRLATAALALPALWLVVEYLPAALFNGFIVAVVAVALYEYFEMALPTDPVGRTFGVASGILVAGGMAWGRPEAWGAALSVAVIGGLILPLLRGSDLPAEVQRLGLSLLGILYVGFFTP